jgi:perosamine synthetase
MSPTYFPTNGHLFYFWKGRVALYVILKALGVGPGDEVIMPGFTCVVVPNAVLYLGASPVYADIEPDTYNLSAATVAPLITERTRVIIAQNTFGLSTDLDPLIELACRYDITVVEDCAHGLGGSYRGRRNGTVAHAAFFSSQWSKPISTGLGGVAYTQDSRLAKKIEGVISELEMPAPSLVQQAILGTQLKARPMADNPSLYYPLVNAYRLLTQKLGLSVGSSTNIELETTKMPPGYAKRMGPLQLRGWQHGLAEIETRTQRRRQIASYYDDYLSSKGIEIPHRPGYATHAMLRYTIRVPNREGLLEKARHMRIPVGDWFFSPLYPVRSGLSQWGYLAGGCLIAEKASQEVINLLTDRPLSQKQLSALIDAARSLSTFALSFSSTSR